MTLETSPQTSIDPTPTLDGSDAGDWTNEQKV